MRFLSKKTKCEYCPKKFRKGKGFRVEIACQHDVTGAPIKLVQNVCNDCADILEKARVQLDRQ